MKLFKSFSEFANKDGMQTNNTNENRMLRKGQFKFGAKLQYSIEDVNETNGFYGTLETQFGLDEVKALFLDAFAVLGTNYDFTDAGALAFLNAKDGRWLADQVVDKLVGAKNMQPYYGNLEEIFSKYINKAKWKQFAIEFNDFALTESVVNEGISVSDERHFGKKGIIIMIDDNGKKVSAIFKDKKNADKFNRNNPSDIKKLLQLANKTKYPKAIDESAFESVVAEGIYAKKSKIVPGEYIKTQYGYFYKRVEGTVGGEDAYVEVKKGKEGKKKTGIHDTVDFDIVDKSIALSESVTEGKFSPMGYAKRVVDGSIKIKDAMKEAGISLGNIAKLIKKVDKSFDVDAAFLEKNVVTEGKFDGIADLVKSLHFEIDPKTAEEKKIAIGKSQGEFSKKKQIEGGEYSLRRFRKSINFGDGTYLGVFIPGSYDAATSTLGDGPHKKAVKKVRWSQKKYDQWLEDVASNGGAENAFDMAQNAKNEPGLIDWVKKEFRGDDPLQRIQWDIEGFAESVVTEARAYKLKASEFGGDTHSAPYNVKGEPTWRVHSTYAIDQVSGENNPDERDVVFFEAMPINNDIYIKIGGINNLKRSNGATVGNNFGTTIEEWKKDPEGIAKEASEFLTDATHLKWINKKARSEGQVIKWALKDDYSSVIIDLVNKSLGLSESVVNEWGSSDQGNFNKSMHKEMGSPKKMPSPFDDKLREIAADNVDHYWDDWPEYKTDRDGLIDNAVRGYLRSFFKKDFELMQQMFASKNNESVVNEAEKYITDEYKVGDKIKTNFGEWEVIETDYAPGKSFSAPFVFKGKDMKRVPVNVKSTNKNAVGYKVTDGDKYPIIGFLYQYKDITKLATVGVEESVLTEDKDMTFVDYLEILDQKFVDAQNAVKGNNGTDAAIEPTRGDILQNFTLFRNYVSALTKKYKGDKTKLRFITEKEWLFNETFESVIENLAINEEKIKYAKGKTYQSSGHWTVVVDSNSSGLDIRVNHSAGWRLDPHDPREETFQLLDNGRQRATLMFRSGNIDKFAQNMFDLNDRTTNGNATKLTAKDYADIIRVWIDMRKANESVVTENRELMKIDSYLNTKDEEVLIDFLDDAYGNSDDRKTRKEWEDARKDLSYGELVDYAVAHAENFGMDLQDIEDAIEVYEKIVTEAKSYNRAELIDFLEKHLSHVRTSEEFDGAEGGVWTSAENGETMGGSQIFDYYSESSKYEFGVLNKFAKKLDKLGWYCEYYDPGTVMIWPN